MRKDELVYDWRSSESSFRDKLAAYVIVGVAFAVLLGAIEVTHSAPRRERLGSATILRFKDDELGKYWTLQAEENGPFPGRLELDGHRGLADVEIDGMGAIGSYRSQFRTLDEKGGYDRELLASRGVSVFPPRKKPVEKPEVADAADPKGTDLVPTLVPYDPGGLEWMPDSLPGFMMPEGMAVAPVAWRFAVNLDEGGNVREAISLGGGDDAGQAAMEDWLLGVRFKPGEGDRWLGLRVDFVNQASDGTDPE